MIFQLTSSRRGWQKSGTAPHAPANISTHILTKRMTITERSTELRPGISTHILTKRMTGQRELSEADGLISTHILTKRMTWRRIAKIFAEEDFNSHPHEEDDCPKLWNNWDKYISTHILTKRMTKTTRCIYETITFQLTSSRRGWRWTITCHSPRRSFQLTSSRRGWPKDVELSFGTYHFNSHPHEEDDGGYADIFPIPYVFQLTSSRRGWLICPWVDKATENFNSHPHEEDDWNWSSRY